MKLTKYWVAICLVITLVIAGGFFGASAVNAAGQTKIAPTEAAPPHPFTIIDTPNGRLVDGSVAVFRLNGTEMVIPLKTHKPWNTAKGMLPADMGGGDYEVSVRQPGGTEFVVGMFKVLAPVVEPTVPTISPTSGAPNSTFTIYDPLGRMQPGDTAVFYMEGSDPMLGQPALNVVVSADGKTLTGYVSAGCPPQTPHYVTVRPAIDLPARFNDLAFFVTA
jgi:hypothetical protein